MITKGQEPIVFRAHPGMIPEQSGINSEQQWMLLKTKNQIKGIVMALIGQCQCTEFMLLHARGPVGFLYHQEQLSCKEPKVVLEQYWVWFPALSPP